MRARRPPDADERPPDYRHRFHAGNVGDVWKHCVLLEVLARLARTERVQYLETHAGEGEYALGATGEWVEGIGRLWPPQADGGATGRYLGLVGALVPPGPRPARYPGSPLLAAATLPADARLRFWERDPTAHAHLAARLRDDRRAAVILGDGIAALEAAAGVADATGEALVVMDPPWTSKEEWTAVPDALARAVRATVRVRFLLWYPVKSLTRPNAMLSRLERSGVAGTIAELVTTPLELRRNRLNGSGVLLVRPPDGALAAVAAAAPAVGARCATVPGAWSLRLSSWPAGT